MAYTPQFTNWEAAVVRRIAWAMGVPMTKALSAIIERTIQCCNGNLICKSCKDDRFCAECPFKDKGKLVCTNDESCPHCGKEIDDLWEYFSDQSDPKLDCPHCSRPIQGQEVITYQLCQMEATDGLA
jgi:hypothetical protein